MLCPCLTCSKTIVLALICQCFWVAAQGQVSIGRVITDRKLQWLDFEGMADSASQYSASTHWSVNYRSHIDSFYSDTAFLSFRTTPLFINYSSWVKKEKIKKKKAAKELLRHEQGHYDLAVICAKTLQETLMATVFFKSNYLQKVDSIANATLQLFTQMEDEYDTETNHMLNKDEQARWSRSIQQLLAPAADVNYDHKHLRQ